MPSFGAIGLVLGTAFFGAQEIERKLRQRREDPTTYRETPISYVGGLILGIGALGLAGMMSRPREATAGLSGTKDEWDCKPKGRSKKILVCRKR